MFSLVLQTQVKGADLQSEKQGASTLTALVEQTQKACNNSAHAFIQLLDILSGEECLTRDIACFHSLQESDIRFARNHSKGNMNLFINCAVFLFQASS